MKNEQFSQGLIMQFLTFIIMIILLILSIFFNFLLPYAIIVAGITLIIMGYNNQVTFQRKSLALIYIIFGIMVIISGIVRIING